MPSTATITAFNVFVSGTRAVASSVNENFDNLRGHLLPIDPNNTTAAATSGTYDLGADDHTWRNAYLEGLSMPTTTSHVDLIRAGVTIGALGITQNSATVTASIGQIAYKVWSYNSITYSPMTTGSTEIGLGAQSYPTTSATRVTIATGGRPIRIEIAPAILTTGGSHIWRQSDGLNTYSALYIECLIDAGTGGHSHTMAGSHIWGMKSTSPRILYPASAHFMYFPAGPTSTVDIRFNHRSNTTTAAAIYKACATIAYEI